MSDNFKIRLLRPPDTETSCMTCNTALDIRRDRHYIVWNPEYDNGASDTGKKRPRGNYQRQCARCYDSAHHRAYERQTADDTVMTSGPPPPNTIF